MCELEEMLRNAAVVGGLRGVQCLVSGQCKVCSV